jgi:hypothetical protein
VTAIGYLSSTIVTSVNGSSGAVTLAAADVGAAPALLVAGDPGTRWFVTSTPFDASVLAQLTTGDRFTYPSSHASAGETYVWNGLSWVFERILAIPAAADAMVYAAVTP